MLITPQLAQQWLERNTRNRPLSENTVIAYGLDILVAYFTGGGPVSPSGTLTTGAPSPKGLSPVAAPYTVTVGGVTATTNYVGLTPGSIGLYQANFVLPKVAAGDRRLVITISGQDSNNPFIAVK